MNQRNTRTPAKAIVDDDVLSLSEALKPAVYLNYAPITTAKLIWPVIFSYFALAVHKPQLIKHLHKVKPPNLYGVLKPFSQYNDVTNALNAYFHPTGERYNTPELLTVGSSGEAPYEGIDEELYDLLRKASFGKPLLKTTVLKTLKRAHEFLKHFNYSHVPTFATLYKAWVSGDFNAMRELLPQDADVYEPMVTFAKSQAYKTAYGGMPTADDGDEPAPELSGDEQTVAPALPFESPASSEHLEAISELLPGVVWTMTQSGVTLSGEAAQKTWGQPLFNTQAEKANGDKFRVLACFVVSKVNPADADDESKELDTGDRIFLFVDDEGAFGYVADEALAKAISNKKLMPVGSTDKKKATQKPVKKAETVTVVPTKPAVHYPVGTIFRDPGTNTERVVVAGQYDSQNILTNALVLVLDVSLMAGDGVYLETYDDDDFEGAIVVAVGEGKLPPATDLFQHHVTGGDDITLLKNTPVAGKTMAAGVEATALCAANNKHSGVGLVVVYYTLEIDWEGQTVKFPVYDVMMTWLFKQGQEPKATPVYTPTEPKVKPTTPVAPGFTDPHDYAFWSSLDVNTKQVIFGKKGAEVTMVAGEVTLPSNVSPDWMGQPAVQEPKLDALSHGQSLGAGVVAVVEFIKSVTAGDASITLNDPTKPGYYGLVLTMPYKAFGGFKYSLPKGTVEKNESTVKAAAREFREETGMNTRIVAFLGDYGSTKKNRLYVGYVTGGNPHMAGIDTSGGPWQQETDAVAIVPLNQNFSAQEWYGQLPPWAKVAVKDAFKYLKDNAPLSAGIAAAPFPHVIPTAPTEAPAPIPVPPESQSWDKLFKGAKIPYVPEHLQLMDDLRMLWGGQWPTAMEALFAWSTTGLEVKTGSLLERVSASMRALVTAVFTVTLPETAKGQQVRTYVLALVKTQSGTSLKPTVLPANLLINIWKNISADHLSGYAAPLYPLATDYANQLASWFLNHDYPPPDSNVDGLMTALQQVIPAVYSFPWDYLRSYLWMFAPLCCTGFTAAQQLMSSAWMDGFKGWTPPVLTSPTTTQAKQVAMPSPVEQVDPTYNGDYILSKIENLSEDQFTEASTSIKLPGSNKPKVMVGPGGLQWFVKGTKDGNEQRVFAEVAASKLLRRVNKAAIPCGYIGSGSQAKLVAPYLSETSPFPAKLTDSSVNDVLSQHVFDMWVADHDGNPENWLNLGGKLIPIDKGSAFRLYAHNDSHSLDPNFTPSGIVGAGVAKTLLKKWGKGDDLISVGALQAIRNRIAQIQSISDTEVLSDLAVYLDVLSDTEAERVRKRVLQAKKTLLEDWTATLKKLRPSFQWPESPLLASDVAVMGEVIKPADLGFKEQDAQEVADAASAGWRGKSIKCDRHLVENMEVHVKQVAYSGTKAASADKATLIHLRLTEAGLQIAEATLAQTAEVDIDPTVPHPIPWDFGGGGSGGKKDISGTGKYYGVLLGALNTLRYHVWGVSVNDTKTQPDGQIKQSKIEAVKALIPELQELVMKSQDKTGVTNGVPNIYVNAMASKYLDIAYDILDKAKNAAALAADPNKPPMDIPEQYLYLEPEKAAAPKKKKPYKIIKESVGYVPAVANTTLNEGGTPVVTLNEGTSGAFNPGAGGAAPQYKIATPIAGCFIYLHSQNADHTRRGAAWAIIPGAASAARVAALLKFFTEATGVSLTIATEKDREVLYLSKQAYVLQPTGSSGALQPVNRSGVVDAPYQQAMAAYASGKTDEAIAALKEYVAKRLTATTGEKVTAAKLDTLPGYGWLSYSNGDAGYFRPLRLGWSRDKLVSLFGDNVYVGHNVSQGSMLSFFKELVAKNGALLSKAVWPMHGLVVTNNSGGSVSGDMAKGGSASIFFGMRTTPFHNGHLYFDISLLLRTDVYVIGASDGWGDTSIERFLDFKTWVHRHSMHLKSGSIGNTEHRQICARHDVDIRYYLHTAKVGDDRQQIINLVKQAWGADVRFGPLKRTPEQVFVY